MQELMWYVMMLSDDTLLSVSKFNLNMLQVFLCSIKDININSSLAELMPTKYEGSCSFKVDLSSGFIGMNLLYKYFFLFSLSGSSCCHWKHYVDNVSAVDSAECSHRPLVVLYYIPLVNTGIPDISQAVLIAMLHNTHYTVSP